ncbi:IQ domain-containing protein K [Microcaecilia unicolor]|uniref:IQ domain-containing protein K n=1 Tax=Microcaecilia unicolor TaxID=1415580 RepID=A0A6P7YQ22_9AMPH|nr:IQ domain-containing protein K [Microcaecilia unicolor]
MARESTAQGQGSKSLWEQICKEYEEELLTSPKVVQPVSRFAGRIPQVKETDELHPEQSWLSDSNIPSENVVLPDRNTCYPREYLEAYIFPFLLPALAEMLHEAEREKCFERKRTKFIACDFLTEWLYNFNPKRKNEAFVDFPNIPFVTDRLKEHPRPPIPLSLVITEEEAALIIQSFWRGYRVRCSKEIQELRQWQKQLREVKHINLKVLKFWDTQEAKVRRKYKKQSSKSSASRPSSIVLPANPQNQF